jgi:alkanesulfonate monooxygenase SsuD/methylene tetrahydromethanopterin reductase-like flavin-dependent oxidoreductase (luciferase family)
VVIGQLLAKVESMDNQTDQKEKLTFGIMLGLFPPWSRMVEQAKMVEALGFDKLWLPDHFVNPEDRDMGWFECWTTLSALAVHTNSIKIGTLVSSMTLRNPALLARMAVAVDHISSGRLELGVGAAGARNCHSMTGVPRWNPLERSERYREFVEIIHQMLNGEVTTYQGKYFNIQEAMLNPGPVSKPRPVLNVAAHGPKAIRLAAQLGDAWNCFYPGKDLTPKQSSDITRHRYERFCESAFEFGRNPEQIGRTFGFGWTSDGLFRSMEAFYDAIGRYREAGITDFCFVYAPGFENWKDRAVTTEDFLLRIAHEALPALRDSN